METTIIADTEVPAVRITREFDAPVDAVFRAHTDPDLVVRWLGPRDIGMRVDRWDCVTGGAYRFVHTRGDDEFGFHGSFHEVRPGEVIVQTFTFDGMPDSVALERMEFTALPGDRCRLDTMSLVDSFAARDQFLASGMESGLVDSYEKLDEVLAG
ncbi:MAG: SRPBCC family protein [Candidatus Nanopelagicales bacterium]